MYLTFTTLRANSADDKFTTVLLLFLKIRLWNFMQIVSIGDDLHDMSNPVFCEQ